MTSPLHALENAVFSEALKRLLSDAELPAVWIIGDNWLAYYGCDDWRIGPDEPATSAEVSELIHRAHGDIQLVR